MFSNKYQDKMKCGLEMAYKAISVALSAAAAQALVLHGSSALSYQRFKKNNPNEPFKFTSKDKVIILALPFEHIKDSDKLKKLKSELKKYGFSTIEQRGKLNQGLELTCHFVVEPVILDIFVVYNQRYQESEYKSIYGKYNINQANFDLQDGIFSSYGGCCDKLKYGQCVWKANTSNAELLIKFLESDLLNLNVLSITSLISLYGKDWEDPCKVKGDQFNNENIITHYYNPLKTKGTLHFCFVLKRNLQHMDLWQQFFSEFYPQTGNYRIHVYLLNEVNSCGEKKEHQVCLDPDSKKHPKWLQNVKNVNDDKDILSIQKQIVNLSLTFSNAEDFLVVLPHTSYPLYSFADTYKSITNGKKSRMDICCMSSLPYASQWMILNKLCANNLDTFFNVSSNSGVSTTPSVVDNDTIDELHKIIPIIQSRNGAEKAEIYPLYGLIGTFKEGKMGEKFKAQVRNCVVVGKPSQHALFGI